MNPPQVCFELPDGRRCVARPGDLIGRVASAAVRLDDPRVSEAHALISLRGRALKLLALRGGLKLANKHTPSSEITLRPGQEIALAKDLSLRVESVQVPTHLPAIAAPSGAPQDLVGTFYSLMPGFTFTPRYEPDALAHLWTTPEGWYLKPRGDEIRLLSVGDVWHIDTHAFELIERPLDEVETHPTIFRGRVHEPLVLVASYTNVHIQREGRPPLLLAGFPARILSELIAFDGPANWEVVARELWRTESNRRLLRQNWDRHLSTLRAKLQRAGIRKDLVRSDGNGHIELLLHPGDTIEDRT